MESQKSDTPEGATQKEQLKDMFEVQLVGKPDLPDLKNRGHWLYFVVKSNFNIVVGEPFHSTIAREAQFYADDEIVHGHLLLSHKEVKFNTTPWNTVIGESDKKSEIEEAVTQKLREWLEAQGL